MAAEFGSRSRSWSRHPAAFISLIKAPPADPCWLPHHPVTRPGLRAVPIAARIHCRSASHTAQRTPRSTARPLNQAGCDQSLRHFPVQQPSISACGRGFAGNIQNFWRHSIAAGRQLVRGDCALEPANPLLGFSVSRVEIFFEQSQIRRQSAPSRDESRVFGRKQAAIGFLAAV